MDVSDGTWLMPGARTSCYAENEAAYVLWDGVQEVDCSMCKSIEPFKEHNLTRRARERGRKKMK